MKSTIALSQTGGRIESLDVLRSFVLLGILIVHCNNGFGFLDSTPMTGISPRFHWLCHMLLEGKCNIAFLTLFGASFGLILRNKKNTSMRFLWRCLLLAGFGVINKFFYWYDALMLFGLGGMMIIPFRYMRTRAILIVTIGLYILTPIFWPLINAGSTIFHNWVPADPPEVATTSFSEILHRPLWEGIKTYAYAVAIHGGVLGCFFFMAMGFLFVRSNMVYHIQDYIKRKWLLMLWAFTLIVIFWQIYGPWPYWLRCYGGVLSVVVCLTYCYTVLYAYYGGGKKTQRRMLKLAPYGRMSLTNYTMQSLICVYIFATVGQTAATATPAVFIGFVGGVFGLQLLFSYYWMKYMTFGPMEWVWRVLTKMDYVPFLRKNVQTKVSGCNSNN